MVDKSYWASELPYPLAPSNEDVDGFPNYKFEEFISLVER